MTMPNVDAQWEERMLELWATLDDYQQDEFIAVVDRLTAELPEGNPIGLFEQAGARDSTGHPDLAVPLYQAALDAGLIGERRRQAVIQMASSVRNLGRPEEAVALLTAELDAATDSLDGAVRTFLALALVDVGREREAVAVAVTALSSYLPRYNRSVARYAQMLTSDAPD